MVELKRTLKCSGCGKENSFYLSADMNINELLAYGKCGCGNSLQLNFNIVESGSSQPTSSNQPSSNEPAQNEAIEESMMEPDFPSDAIRDLIEG